MSGIIMLTNDDMDDLVDEWHDPHGLGEYMSLTEFLRFRTDLSYDQIVHWIETAELPDAD